MKSWALVLNSLEEDLGYKIDSDFAATFAANKFEWKNNLAVLKALNKWRKIFADIAVGMKYFTSFDCLSKPRSGEKIHYLFILIGHSWYWNRNRRLLWCRYP